MDCFPVLSIVCFDLKPLLMKPILIFTVLGLTFVACTLKKEMSSVNPVNWEKRTVDNSLPDSLIRGTSYLAVYSHVYSNTEHRTHDLTVTVSMRNTNRSDTIYIDKAEYFDTQGKSIRTYFDKTIFVAPMETVEIVIDERDDAGGSGANFLFNWRIHSEENEPLFDGVMISTSGQQGLSFATKGHRII